MYDALFKEKRNKTDIVKEKVNNLLPSNFSNNFCVTWVIFTRKKRKIYLFESSASHQTQI